MSAWAIVGLAVLAYITLANLTMWWVLRSVGPVPAWDRGPTALAGAVAGLLWPLWAVVELYIWALSVRRWWTHPTYWRVELRLVAAGVYGPWALVKHHRFRRMALNHAERIERRAPYDVQVRVVPPPPAEGYPV